MESQQQPQPPSMTGRPWFRLASQIRMEPPVAAAAAPVPAPAPERPLLRLGSFLRTPGAVPLPPQEPIQAPTQLQARVPTPPPTATTSPPPAVPSGTATPLATAATQDQQPPRQALPPTLAPSPTVRAPSPPAPPPPLSPRVIRLSEPVPSPSPAVRPPTPPLTTAISPPPPAPAPAPSPRLPSPPLHPEPETKPVVTVVTAQPALIQEPTNGTYKNKNKNSSINGNGGKLRGATPPPPSLTSTPKKPDLPVAAAPGKKKSGASDEAESGMRVLTLAGENMGAHMNLGGGGHRGGIKGQGRHLTQTQPAQSVEKVALGGNSSTDEHNFSASKDVKASAGASNWKAGEESAKPMAALVNSNVQSVNNSIMFNSSCTQQSPGVYVTLSSTSRPSSHRLLGDSNGKGGGTATPAAGDDTRRTNH